MRRPSIGPDEMMSLRDRPPLAGTEDLRRSTSSERLASAGSSGGVLLGLGSAVAVISALVGGPPRFLREFVDAHVPSSCLAPRPRGMALIRWNQGDAGVSDQRARLVASISIVALCVGLGGEILRHPTPMVAVGNFFAQEGAVTVVGAACGSDELQSISVVQPTALKAGRPREILWAISDPTPERGVHIFDVGARMGGIRHRYRVGQEPLPFYEPLEVEVDTRRSSTSLPVCKSAILSQTPSLPRRGLSHSRNCSDSRCRRSSPPPRRSRHRSLDAELIVQAAGYR